jgi:hypothetical protein
MAAREQALIRPENIIDIQFSDFRKSPVAAVHTIYEYFGLELSEATNSQMEAFLASGKDSERHGKHKYSIAAAGLDIPAERKRFAEYQSRHGVASETI